MIKTLLNMLAGAIVFAMGAALAITGTPPLPNINFALQDGQWLLGLAGGVNELYAANITAHAGGGQASCFALVPGTQLYEVDTVATSGDSICLPFAVPGMDIQIRNAASANSMNVFGQTNSNALTGTADTINGTAGSSAYAVPSNNSVACFVAKAGVWSCVKGS